MDDMVRPVNLLKEDGGGKKREGEMSIVYNLWIYIILPLSVQPMTTGCGE
jgi:hypothetical protein